MKKIFTIVFPSGAMRRISVHSKGEAIENAGKNRVENAPFKLYEGTIPLKKYLVYQRGNDTDFTPHLTRDIFDYFYEGLFAGKLLTADVLHDAYLAIFEFLREADIDNPKFQPLRLHTHHRKMDDGTEILLDAWLTYDGVRLAYNALDLFGRFLPGGLYGPGTIADNWGIRYDGENYVWCEKSA